MKTSPHYLNTLKFWRAFKAFNLPDLIEPRRDETKNIAKLYVNDELPWKNPKYLKSQRNKKWKHTLYFCCIPKQDVLDIISDQLSSQEETIEPLTGNTWMSALVVDERGIPYDK